MIAYMNKKDGVHAGYHKNKGKKRLLVLGAIALLCICVPLCINGFVRQSAKAYMLTPGQAAELDADCILVLGTQVWPDGSPSGVLEDRLLTGIGAYESGASNRLLMSGDHGQPDYDEVNAMKAYAVEKGVPSEHIFMDHAGFSTYESMYRAKDIFQAQRVLIVTQQYHLYRAVYIARKMGLDAYGLAADIRPYPGLPRYEARELLARNKDFVMTLFMPEPTYLGEAVPVFGNGNVTNDQTTHH